MEHNPASLDYPDDAPITYQIEYRGNRLTGVKIL
jgi:hypothetical protein